MRPAFFPPHSWASVTPRMLMSQFHSKHCARLCAEVNRTLLDSDPAAAPQERDPIAITIVRAGMHLALKMPMHIHLSHATKLNDGCHYVSQIACFHCGTELASTRERVMSICYDCRRMALLTGYWPEDLLASNQTRELPGPFEANAVLNPAPIRDSDH